MKSPLPAGCTAAATTWRGHFCQTCAIARAAARSCSIPDDKALFGEAERLRGEFVIQVRGLVRARPAGTANANLASGKVELLRPPARRVLNRSEPLPFQLDEQVSEEVRLRYRYIDLRREEMSQRLRLRHRVTSVMRRFMDDHGFIDIETPMLTEGHARGRARLPRAQPHASRQLLRAAAVAADLQAAADGGRASTATTRSSRCFRDEDLRADRQPEFTQLDVETSFLSQDEIMALMEELVRDLFAKIVDVQPPRSDAAHDLRRAMRRYGSDKPDLRVSPGTRGRCGSRRRTVISRFSQAPRRSSTAALTALRAPGGGAFSRSEIDAYTASCALWREGSRLHQGLREGQGPRWPAVASS